MKNRIKQIIELEKITASRLAEILKVQRSNISHILSGRNNPSLEFIQKILTYFPKINSDWLIMGTGNMYNSEVKGSKQLSMDTLYEREKVSPQRTEVVKKEERSKKPLSSPAVELKKTKQVDRIIIFYNDNTFEIFNQLQT